MSNQDLISPRFYTQPVEDVHETRKQGRPIFKDAEFVEVRFAGDKQRVHVAPAHEAFKRDKHTNEPITYAMEYAPLYQKFKEGLVQDGGGTPLDELTFLTAAKRSELRALNIKNAEALAALDGEPLKRLGMGGRELKNQAAAYLEKASGSAVEARLAAENETLKTQMEAMQAQIAELMAGGKGATAPAPAETPVETEAASPFAEFDDEDIRNWLKDGGFEVDGRWNRKTLLGKADEANKALAERNKVEG